MLDDIFQIPGTKIRFGLDPIVGLVPGLGDIITGLLSFLIVFAAWQRELPRIAILRMVANIGIDTILGAVPIFGDVFDTIWKSNRMNYSLLVCYCDRIRRELIARDWLFFLLLLLCIAATVVLPIVVAVGIFYLLRSRTEKPGMFTGPFRLATIC